MPRQKVKMTTSRSGVIAERLAGGWPRWMPWCPGTAKQTPGLRFRGLRQARRDSNPQHAVLETAALPLELLA